MKNGGLVLALAALAFVAGFATSSGITGFGALQADVSVRCVESDACVGNTVDAFLRRYDEDRGGLTGVFCTGRDGLVAANGYFFLWDIVQGRTCPSQDYALEFRNPSTRTLVWVVDGIVTKIGQGPLHVLDL
jgi:hypothetical protein